jgi:acyl-CoA thioesterase-1
MTDVRICFVGDSFTAGVGDPDSLGWVGRVAQQTHRAGVLLTSYNLGVRRDTSLDVQARFVQEVQRRLAAGADNRVVLSFGTNDTQLENGSVRVEPLATLAALADLLEWTREHRLPTFVVGPPPVVDDAHNHRLLELTALMRELTKRRGVPFVPIAPVLAESTRWRAELSTGDGAHPRSVGYQLLARAILDGGWWDWLGTRPAGGRA